MFLRREVGPFFRPLSGLGSAGMHLAPTIHAWKSSPNVVNLARFPMEAAHDRMNPRWRVPIREVNVRVGRVLKGLHWRLEYVGMLGKLWLNLNQWYFDSNFLSLWISMNNSLTWPFLCLAPQETSQQRGCKWCWCPQQPSSGCEWRSWCSVCATMKPSVAQSHNEGQLSIESNVTDWYYLPTPCLWKHSRLSLLTRSTSKKVDIRGCCINERWCKDTSAMWCTGKSWFCYILIPYFLNPFQSQKLAFSELL